MIRYAATISMLILSGCAGAKPLLYSKQGTTEQAFQKDRYECLQQAQQARSSTYVNAYGGSQEGRIVTSGPLYTACMSARGYTISTEHGQFRSPPGTSSVLAD